MSRLENNCNKIRILFEQLIQTPGRNDKQDLVEAFRSMVDDDIKIDLDFCFEVLAGKHKLGYTYRSYPNYTNAHNYVCEPYIDYNIRDFVEVLKDLSSTEVDMNTATLSTPENCRVFIAMLVNREWKLGYSNKDEMITNLSPMLAKKYPESHHEQYYYIQEKLDGNRCIAYFDVNEDKWKFQSRSGKPLKVDFDMSWVPDDAEKPVFDGEIMTLGHAGSRDFNRTSGAINGKYTNKSDLHYYIYDIVAEKLTYEQRKEILDEFAMSGTGAQCSILPVLDKVWVYPNTDYNWKLDEWLDTITAKGGEGIMLRDPDAYYQHKRTDALLKYKKLQSMDLRITGWNEGKGKYEGAIGSFICENDEGTIKVNVAGISDAVRWSDPDWWIGKIIEVAYFDYSVSKTNDKISLRFPRMKKLRDDKNETSVY
jgi:DNA ligase-1